MSHMNAAIIPLGDRAVATFRSAGDLMISVDDKAVATWNGGLGARAAKVPADAGIAAERSENFANYRYLALTVIERAFRDMLKGICSSTAREGAREFLVVSPMMQHWCRVAGLDPRRVILRASHLLLDRGAGRGVLSGASERTAELRRWRAAARAGTGARRRE